VDFSLKYDIVVVGAGIAGVSAALAAARRGHRVALVEKQTLIGGLATAGLIFVYLPLCDGEGVQVTGGIAEELLLRGLDFSPFELPQDWQKEAPPQRGSSSRYKVDFAPASLTLVMDELLAEANVDLWLDSRVCDIRQSAGRINAIELENASGRGMLQGSCFVDASGEALLVRRAGGEFSTAPNSLSLWVMEMSPKASSIYAFTDSLHIQPFRFPFEVYGPGSGLDGKDVSNYTRFCWQELRKYYRDNYAAGHTPFNHYPVHLPTMPQFRKMAAAKCLKTLNSGDEFRRFEESVGMTGDWRKPGPVWETPLGCLIPEKTDGVLMAGRCISAIEDAWEVYRVIPAAAMTGEAAGISAAICVEQRRTPHELAAAPVQDALRQGGIKLHLDEVGLGAKYAN